jgi:hypothetical protein
MDNRFNKTAEIFFEKKKCLFLMKIKIFCVSFFLSFIYLDNEMNCIYS